MGVQRQTNLTQYVNNKSLVLVLKPAMQSHTIEHRVTEFDSSIEILKGTCPVHGTVSLCRKGALT